MAAFLMLDMLFRKERLKNPEGKGTFDVKIKKEPSTTQNDGPCRVCLKDGNIPIFTENFRDSIAAHIRFFADIEVHEDDGLPKQLCHDCHNLLQGALLFRQQALDTDERLRNRERSGMDSSLLVPLSRRNNEQMTDDEPITNDELITTDDLVINNDQMSNDDPITYDDIDDDRDWKFIELQIEKCERRKIELEEKAKKNKTKIELPKPVKIDCKRCMIDFTNLEEYKSHLTSEDHKSLRRPCPDCGKIFNTDYMRQHMMRAHNTVKPFICEVCGKSYAISGAFKVHVAIHNSRLPFKCAECPYRGRFRESLKLHMRVHTGEKPFSCELCGKRFICRSNLNVHLFTHTKQARFKCDQCGKGFYHETKLNEHMRVDHGGIKEHECTVCGKMFGRRKQMTKHTKKVHHRKPGTIGPLPLYKRYDRLQQSDKDGSTTVSAYPPSGKHVCLT